MKPRTVPNAPYMALPNEIRGTFEGVYVLNGIVLCAHDTQAIASKLSGAFLGEVPKHRAWSRDVSRVAA